jgi:hypothetical protein
LEFVNVVGTSYETGASFVNVCGSHVQQVFKAIGGTFATGLLDEVSHGGTLV